jgi:rubrerythrin
MTMATEQNAREAFAGESQANRKYQAFAEKAESEGYKNISRLFKAASEAEAIHAKKLLKAMGSIASTKENLEKAVKGETHEYTEMYPEFVREAEAEKQSDALLAFTYAMKAEEVHANLYKEALKSLNAGQDMSNRTVWLCPVCGNIFLGQPPEKCPICSVFKKMFREIQ